MIWNDPVCTPIFSISAPVVEAALVLVPLPEPLPPADARALSFSAARALARRVSMSIGPLFPLPSAVALSRFRTSFA